MGGIRKICKMYGGMKIQGKDYVWDYANDEPVPASEMPFGSERHAESEKARWLGMTDKEKNEEAYNEL